MLSTSIGYIAMFVFGYVCGLLFDIDDEDADYVDINYYPVHTWMSQNNITPPVKRNPKTGRYESLKKD